jgi:hypothetical protein
MKFRKLQLDLQQGFCCGLDETTLCIDCAGQTLHLGHFILKPLSSAHLLCCLQLQQPARAAAEAQ